MLLSYRVHSALTFIACSAGMFILSYASLYANYLMERNAGAAGRPFNLDWSINGVNETNIIPIILLIVLLFLPFITVLANKKNGKAQLIWMIISLIMALGAYSTIGSGGDRKGCQECTYFMLAYIALIPIPSIIFIVFGIYTNLKSR